MVCIHLLVIYLSLIRKKVKLLLLVCHILKVLKSTGFKWNIDVKCMSL